MEKSSSTSSSERPSLWSRLPGAAVSMVVGCLLLTLACWAGIAAGVDRDKPTLIFVGDSFTGNYRFEAGDRLEDLTEEALGARWQVFNFARPGARTLDMLMQVHQAQTLVGDVELVVLPLFVSKFQVGDPYVRLDKRGDNLKWLRLSTSSGPVLDSFGAEYLKKLTIHKLGLLVGFYELLEHQFVERVQQPSDRARMRSDPPARRRAIDAKSDRHAQMWGGVAFDEAAFGTTGAAQDLSLLIDNLKAQGIPLLIVLIPAGNMDVVDRKFSPEGKANLERARQASRSWCAQRDVPSIDLTQRLPGQLYDDFTHLKEVEGNAIITRAITAWMSSDGALERL